MRPRNAGLSETDVLGGWEAAKGLRGSQRKRKGLALRSAKRLRGITAKEEEAGITGVRCNMTAANLASWLAGLYGVKGVKMIAG